MLGQTEQGPGHVIHPSMTLPALTDGPQKHGCGTHDDDDVINIMDCHMSRLIHNMRIMQENLPLYEDEQKFIDELDELVDDTLRHMTDPFEKWVPKTEAEKKEAAKAKRDAAKAGKGVGSLYAAGKILEKEAKLMRRKEQRKKPTKKKK
jgi:hypothetical protein